VTLLVEPNRRCPKCDSPKYLFRARKNVDAPDGRRLVETKYRCQACEHVWKEQVTVLTTTPGQDGTASPREA